MSWRGCMPMARPRTFRMRARCVRIVGTPCSTACARTTSRPCCVCWTYRAPTMNPGGPGGSAWAAWRIRISIRKNPAGGCAMKTSTRTRTKTTATKTVPMTKKIPTTTTTRPTAPPPPSAATPTSATVYTALLWTTCVACAKAPPKTAAWWCHRNSIPSGVSKTAWRRFSRTTSLG
ncbi:hypothetical protein D3C86_1290390 [compost metagenome]